MRFLTVYTLAVAFLFLGCGGERGEQPATGESGLRQVRLVLNWFPEMEHGGFYAAQVHGYYAEEGLDVEIVPGGVDINTIQLVGAGRYEFGIANADQVIMGRAAQAGVMTLMAPLQVSPRCIMVHADSGIESLADLRNIRLAMNPGGAFAQFIRQNYPLENVQIVNYTGNISLFLVNKDFAQQGYNFSEPFIARQHGAEPRVLLLADYGFNPYTSVVLVRDQMVRDDPELAGRFVRASVRGWDHYMRDPQQSNDVIERQNPEMGREILEFGVDVMQDMVYTEEARTHGTGIMTAERWKTLLDQLVDLGIVNSGAVDPEACYTTEFLPGTAVQTQDM